MTSTSSRSILRLCRIITVIILLSIVNSCISHTDQLYQSKISRVIKQEMSGVIYEDACGPPLYLGKSFCLSHHHCRGCSRSLYLSFLRHTKLSLTGCKKKKAGNLIRALCLLLVLKKRLKMRKRVFFCPVLMAQT